VKDVSDRHIGVSMGLTRAASTSFFILVISMKHVEIQREIVAVSTSHMLDFTVV
jgi:hypothetical protein